MLKCPQCDQKLTEPNNIGHPEHTCQACARYCNGILGVRWAVGDAGR